MQARSFPPARPHRPLALAAALCLLASCAASGPSSPSARPVFYPNATLERVGQAQAQRDADECMAKAGNAGLTPEEKNNAVERGAVKGAAIGGTAAAVHALVNGRELERVATSGVKGAAVGGSAGAVAGALNEKPNPTYRHFVQRCLRDKGFDVIGWN